MNHRRQVVVGVAALFLAVAPGARAAAPAAPAQTGWFAVTEENDSLSAPTSTTHQDRHYTQGLKAVLFGGDDCLPDLTTNLTRGLPAWGIDPVAGNLGWVLVGQNIYTPENLHDSAPIPTDRPYAGWLYTGPIFQRRGTVGADLAVLENFEINLGMVGPESIAAEAQKTVHRWWFHADIPQGWDHQIKTEPGLVLKYARLWRYSPTPDSARYFDLIPRAGAELGNVQTFATAGATARFGYKLPPDFGPQINDSPATANGGLTPETPPFFAYLFGALDGRAIARDITLDGNSFRSSASVDKYYFVADLTWGVALAITRYVDISYTHIIRTPEFHGQVRDDVFGSITVKGKFCF